MKKPKPKPKPPVTRIRRQHRSRRVPPEEPVMRARLSFSLADDPGRLARLSILLHELIKLYCPPR